MELYNQLDQLKWDVNKLVEENFRLRKRLKNLEELSGLSSPISATEFGLICGKRD